MLEPTLTARHWLILCLSLPPPVVFSNGDGHLGKDEFAQLLGALNEGDDNEADHIVKNEIKKLHSIHRHRLASMANLGVEAATSTDDIDLIDEESKGTATPSPTASMSHEDIVDEIWEHIVGGESPDAALMTFEQFRTWYPSFTHPLTHSLSHSPTHSRKCDRRACQGLSTVALTCCAVLCGIAAPCVTCAGGPVMTPQYSS